MYDDQLLQFVLRVSLEDGQEAPQSPNIASPSVPNALLCPISLHVMEDPVFLSPTGHSYDRKYICQWLLETPDRDPQGGTVDTPFDVVDNYGLRNILTGLGHPYTAHVDVDL